MQPEAYFELRDNSLTHWWYRARRGIVVDYARSFGLGSVSGERILDIGCGFGSVMCGLMPFGDVYGIDSNVDCVNFCNRLAGDGHTICGEFPCDMDIEQVGLFDWVFMLDVLEHIQDDASALCSVRELLSDGGKFVFTVPLHKDLWSSHDVSHGHYRRYEFDSLLDLIGRCGFRVLHASHFNSRLYYPIVIVRSVKRRLGIEVSDESVGTNGFVGEILHKTFSGERFRLCDHKCYSNGVSAIVCAEACGGDAACHL